MQLTETNKKILNKALLDKWFEKGPKCPICQGSEWEVSPHIFDFEDLQIKRKIPNEATVFPAIIIVCNKCSYCLTFSAMKLGLVLHDIPTDDATKERTS